MFPATASGNVLVCSERWIEMTLIAAEVFLRARGGVYPFCAKLHHANNKRCIFRHGSPPRTDKPM